MKICVTAQENNLNAEIDPRFGRCRFFLFVDEDSKEFQAYENPNAVSGGGAGIQSAQQVAERGAKAVLTGNVGPNAYQTLHQAGIRVITGASGTVRDALEKFSRGEYSESNGPSVGPKFGA
ncbi:MAG: dinitrogenase iron-molybdenum cofactor biosynthesis protein [Candidatus Omnitrophica bacterium]|nr:dinitrogenase iron-molybdenum cofactor biosynthesis protein [Candidatus Omnitrophota bacterium]